ncbi:MAG: tetratricopeptide repeat protein, partial [Rhodothermales bacterium]|nr:tetratricopeptide repeat protein [Rhodothermales bacterium]
MTIRARRAAFLTFLAAHFLVAIAAAETPGDGICADDGPMLLHSPVSIDSMELGRELLLRFRIDEAEHVFTTLSRRSDGKAAAYYFLGYSSLLKLLVSDDQIYYEEFVHRSDSLQHAVAAAPDSPWKAFFEAERDLQHSLVRAKRGKFVRAALAGRRAYSGYERLVRDCPDFLDAYKGLGMIHVAVGSLPGIYQTVLGILGVHGTVEGGLDELRASAESSRYGREEAAILLSILSIIVDTGSDAGVWLTPLYDRFSDSPLFGHLYGFYLYSNRRAEAALPVLLQASQNSDRTEYFDFDYLDFYLADTYFRLDRYDEAILYYQRYLDRHGGPALKALASLRMGLALEMVGQRLAAVSFYQDVVAARDFDSDRAARRRAVRLISEPLAEIDRALLTGRNAFDSGRYDRAARILEDVLPADT